MAASLNKLCSYIRSTDCMAIIFSPFMRFPAATLALKFNEQNMTGGSVMFKVMCVAQRDSSEESSPWLVSVSLRSRSWNRLPMRFLRDGWAGTALLSSFTQRTGALASLGKVSRG
jgi:hypothetical protein